MRNVDPLGRAAPTSRPGGAQTPGRRSGEGAAPSRPSTARTRAAGRTWAAACTRLTAVAALTALGLAACGGGEEAPEGEARRTAVVEARSQGLAALQEDRLDRAEEHFRRLTELTPEEGAGPANLALVALRRGDGEAAERRAREAVGRAPEDPWPRLVLAKALEQQGRRRDARAERRRALELDPGNLRALWALAGGHGASADEAADPARRRELLARVVERAPSNLAARLELVEARLEAGRAEAAAAGLEELRSLVPELPPAAAPAFDRALARARAGDAAAAREAAARLHEAMRMTSRYQGDVADLRGPEGEATGFPALSFSHEISLDVPDEAAVLAALRFADATGAAGLDVVGAAEGPSVGGSGGRPAEARRPGTGAAGAAASPATRGEAVAALGDYDGDGDPDLYAWIPGEGEDGGSRLFRNDLGRMMDVTPDALRSVSAVRAAAFADVDADGHPDLYLVRRGPNRLFRSRGGEGLEDVTREAGVAAAGAAGSGAGTESGAGAGGGREGAAGGAGGGTPLFADLDHDGDLDLFLGTGDGGALFRNDGDGRFARVDGAMGLDAGGPVLDAAFADVDDDADLDVVTARGRRGVGLYVNLRQDRFAPAADSLGLGGVAGADAVAVGDYDNDGRPDLAVAGAGAPPALYRNRGEGRFRRDGRSSDVLAEAGPGATDARFLDFDNDGRLDLVLAGGERGTGLSLLHNEGDGGFREMSDRLPSGPRPARQVEVFDYNRDGDRDLMAVTAGGLRLLRNDGGSVNHHFDLRLVARGPGSGKVNRFGVGSKVEVRAGDLYQSRTVTGPVTHFGLGHRLKADVVRIVWTNGVPQYIYYPGTDQDLLQDQQLKGSCAFVYAWDGDGYEFVTDAVWRSAIGMPVGIMAGGEPPAAGGEPPAVAATSGGGAEAGPRGPPDDAGAGSRRAGPAGGTGAAPAAEIAAAAASGRRYAPPGASREYVRIPPDRLAEEDGRYRLQLTEELWEVAYVDEVKLLAVDHPDSVQVFVDEAFVPPAPPELRLYRVRDALAPASARDGEGDDLLPALRARDDRHAADLEAGPYQGIVEPHEMVLELPPEAARAERPFLFLQGWIFPTDASINVALAQAPGLEARPPRLEVPDGEGGWRPTGVRVGFPSGKEKTVVVDLGGVVPEDDPRVRIRTNMQIYWDRAFFAAGDVAGPAVAGGAEAAAARLRPPRAPGGRAAEGGGAGPSAAPRAGGADGSEPRVRLLRPAAADLHFRGFSRGYRKGGRHGPHWFDYDDVTEASPWLPIRGRFTRYGDVRPLLEEPDDMYVVMAPGDETTVEFEAAAAPAVPVGWTRTFLLYTDGWIKDADLNTATGATVGPLPFHGQSSYPPPPGEAYPRDSVHRDYLRRYQTREVGGSTLRLAPAP